MSDFGARRIYYNNFTEHLLNAFNPNMTHPDLIYCWSDDQWRGMMNMIADCNFNIFEFWLTPRMFCREALESDYGKRYIHQMRVAAPVMHRNTA